mgnify:CR=1 FL=1
MHPMALLLPDGVRFPVAYSYRYTGVAHDYTDDAHVLLLFNEAYQLTAESSFDRYVSWLLP